MKTNFLTEKNGLLLKCYFYILYIDIFVILVHVPTHVLWLLMHRHSLGAHTFARFINFIIFRIACPQIGPSPNGNSNWQFDNATLSVPAALNYDKSVTLTCATGYWLHDWSTAGNPNTTQTVKCDSNGSWTPAKDCSVISMNFCENCLTSFPEVLHPENIKNTFIACSFITSTILWLLFD